MKGEKSWVHAMWFVLFIAVTIVIINIVNSMTWMLPIEGIRVLQFLLFALLFMSVVIVL